MKGCTKQARLSLRGVPEDFPTVTEVVKCGYQVNESEGCGDKVSAFVVHIFDHSWDKKTLTLCPHLYMHTSVVRFKGYVLTETLSDDRVALGRAISSPSLRCRYQLAEVSLLLSLPVAPSLFLLVVSFALWLCELSLSRPPLP